MARAKSKVVTRAVKPPSSFVTIDASTQSLAFAFVVDGTVVQYGKVKFEGANLDEKIRDIALKTYAFFLKYKTDTIVIEDTVYINSPQTVTTLSKCHGALLAAAYLAGVKHTFKVSPIAWQSYIGTRLLTAPERARIKSQTPGRSASWYKAKERQIRKQKTIDTVNKRFGFGLSDDDIADACGLAIFSIENWKKVTTYAKK